MTHNDQAFRRVASYALATAPDTPALAIARRYVRAWLLGKPVGDGTLIEQFIAELEDAAIVAAGGEP